MSDATVIPRNATPFESLDIKVVEQAAAQADVKVYAATSENFDSELDGSVAAYAAHAGFKGAVGATVHNFEEDSFLGLVGLGKLSQDNYQFSKVGAGLASLATATKAKVLSVSFPVALSSQQIRIALEHFFFNLYVDSRFRADKKEVALVSLEIIAPNVEQVQAGLAEAIAVARGTFLTRDLVNSPANVAHPPSIAAVVEDLAKATGLKVKVLDRAECEQLGMGSFVAVGKGSIHQPKFVHLTYTPVGAVTKKLVFIGKGVTFDTGGYNVKLAMMELMKTDMGGCGAVFGAAQAIATLKPANVEVHFISALAENMISHEAYRPGDILTASNGKTIEILNTDAEGRLTMADALVYAEKNIAPDAIVELSTLTGAQLVALGPKIGALMCKDKALTANVKAAAKEAGELVWELPLFGEYLEGLKSKIADITNLDTSRNAGSISAGLFLNEFVEKTPYAHIDMAGPVWNNAQGSATGYGVRMLLSLVEQYAKLE